MPLITDPNINCHYAQNAVALNPAPRTDYNVAAASIAPAALKAVLLVMTISTGYFHSMNFAQPDDSQVSRWSWYSYPCMTYRSMRTCAQSISQCRAP